MDGVLFSDSVLALVVPLMNQSSSSAMPLNHTYLVVNKGNTLSRRLNLICTPNLEYVPLGCKYKLMNGLFNLPVPVLSSFKLPFSMISFTRLRYWHSSCNPSPVRLSVRLCGRRLGEHLPREGIFFLREYFRNLYCTPCSSQVSLVVSSSKITGSIGGKNVSHSKGGEMIWVR